jgi:hypothetical protein|tara:strand:+ start:896 stop:1141 length:246 start_codon:yes stop_codon:yes gene_type:complete
MPRTIFRQGDLVVYKPITKVIDDQTEELIEYKEFEGIGVIIDASAQHYGWVKIWWQKHPFANLDTEYLVLYIEHYDSESDI